MNPGHSSQTKFTTWLRSYPWQVFLFLTVTFFFVYHDLTSVQTAQDGMYNRSQDDIVAGVAEGSPARQAAFLILATFALYGLVRNAGQRLRREGTLSRLLIAFAAWASLSTLWADDVALTFKRLIAFGILCLTATYVVRRFSLRHFISWAFFTTALFLLIGIGVEIVSGSFQPFSFGYRFSGTEHPNAEGIQCSILFLSGIAAGHMETERRRLFWTVACIGFVFLVLTGSRTSLISTLVASACYATVIASKKIGNLGIPATGLLLFSLVLIVGIKLLPQKVVTMGRDDDESSQVESFTGRTLIWQDVSEYIGQRPLLGHGYAGFWRPGHIIAISEKEGWGVPDSHSAYVDYTLALGAVGVTLYLLCLFAGLYRAIYICRVKPDAGSAFIVGLLAFCMLNGFLESAIAEGSLLTFLCMVALLRLAFVPLQGSARISADGSSRHEVCAA